MSTFLLVQGIDPVVLDDSENFNKVRKRCNDAKQNVIDYENGNIEDKDFQPYHLLSFKTDGGGRISIGADRIIGIGSDEAKDGGGE